MTKHCNRCVCGKFTICTSYFTSRSWRRGSSRATYPRVSVKSDTAELVVHPSGSTLHLIEVRLASVKEALHLGSKRFSLSLWVTAGGVGRKVWEEALNANRFSFLAAVLACEGDGPASYPPCSWEAAAAAGQHPGSLPSVWPPTTPWLFFTTG